MVAAKTRLREECIRLRQEERLSVRAIHQRTGASIGSCSRWLRDFPLAPDEVSARQASGATNAHGWNARPELPESGLHRTIKALPTPLTTSQVAKVSEAAVLLRLLAHGFTVFGSVFDGEVADWVVQTPEGRLVKVQVKTVAKNFVRSLKGYRRVEGERPYTSSELDFLVGFDIYTDRAYVWSFEEIQHYKSGVATTPDAEERWDKLRSL